MQFVPIPDFLIGRNIWDLWLWSYAMRTWRAIEGGNVLFVFHQTHGKPGHQLAEYETNSQRARDAAQSGQGVTCNRLQCADTFFYRGRCREAGAVVEAAEQRQLFCVRRKEAGWTPTNDKDDQKIGLSRVY